MSNEMTFTLTKRQAEQTFRCLRTAYFSLAAEYAASPEELDHAAESRGEVAQSLLAEIREIGQLFEARIIQQIEEDGLVPVDGGRFNYPAPAVG